jgi:predicted TIM-barrel fold metal-dependent hydrolase
MIIDAHCHAGKGDGASGPKGKDAPLDRYLRRARAAGIEKSVLLGTFVDDYDDANAYVARVAARYPGRFIPFAIVHPERDAGRIKIIIENAVEKWGFKGIKVHMHDAPASAEVCEAARSYQLPVLYDVMGKIELLERVLPRYPDVTFIVPHLGSFADDWRAQSRMAALLVKYPNLYTDTSGVRRFDYILDVLERAGPGRILFGTDGPWLHPSLELKKIRLLNLPPADESLVLGNNIMRLIGAV